MAQVINHIYQLKRGKVAAVENSNPFLRYGEPIVVYFPDGKIKLKIGDGVNNYLDLPFIGEEKVISYTTYFDFPNYGKEGIIYQAQKEIKLYQWSDANQMYQPLCEEEFECIFGGNASDL